MITEKEINENFELYLQLIQENIKRPGVDNLINWLKSKDAKSAPASTKYHLSCKGGLIKHSLNVYNRLKKLIELEYPTMVQDESGEMKKVENTCPYTDETIAIVALLHDISKVDFYEVQERNTKDENGNWIKVPYYSVKNEDQRFIFGSHCMNSFYMANTFLNLTYQEGLAILHHMGGLDSTEDRFSVKNLAEAYKKSPLALLLMQADMSSTFIDEGIDE